MSPPRTKILATLQQILSEISSTPTPKNNPGYAPARSIHCCAHSIIDVHYCTCQLSEIMDDLCVYGMPDQ